MALPHILTFQDAIEQTADWAGGDILSQSSAKVVRAVMEAYRSLPGRYEWKGLMREGSLRTNAAYSTGTIAYTNSSRTITLTGGTFPDWAADAEIRFGSQSYPVAQRTSSTTVILGIEANPGADVAAGTSYTLFQQGYRLPIEFLEMSEPCEPNNNYGLSEATTAQIINWRSGRYIAGEPLYWGIISDRENTVGGRKKIVLWPVPQTSRLYKFKIKVRPRSIRNTGTASKFSQGTIQGAAASSTITGTGTAFEESWEGAVLRRYSDGTNKPTGLEGEYPYVEQFVIDQVTDATTLTITGEIPEPFSGVKYVVSDPIDMDELMMNPFLRLCEYQFAQANRSKDISVARQAFMEALEYAREDDMTRIQEPGGTTAAVISMPLKEWGT